MNVRDGANHERAEREAHREAERVQANREELAERIGQAVPEDGTVQPLKGLYLSRISTPLQPLHGVLDAALCVIAQGSKEILLGDSRYLYDPEHYLLASVELPTIGRVLDASSERPYLGLRLLLPPTLVGSIMVEAGHALLSSYPRHVGVRAIDVSPLNVDLLDAVVRLVRLLDSPGEAQVLMPLITREIIYRLLAGEQGARLRYLAAMGGYTPYIAKAVERLRQDFDKPVRIEEIASELGMSVSGFHYHFKAVTALSPLQYQKRLRLQEARSLMLSEDLEAASAASRVGYHDAAHFSREYKSLFGVPPIRDIQQLRQEAR